MADNSLEQTTKKCARCKEIKPVTEFYPNPRKKNGFRSRCKRCLNRPSERTIIARYCSQKEGHKVCTKCGALKPLDEFYPQAKKPMGVRSACIECIRMATRRTNLEAVKRYQKTHQAQIAARRTEYRENRRAHFKRYDSKRHRAQLEKKWSEMGATPRPERCEICLAAKDQWGGRHRTLVVDHCHRTGRFRGWLCDRCNRVLGIVTEDQNLLHRMAEYLETHRAIYQETGPISSQ